MTKEHEQQIEELVIRVLTKAANGHGAIKIRVQSWWISLCALIIGLLGGWVAYSHNAKDEAAALALEMRIGMQELKAGQNNLSEQLAKAAADRWSGTQMKVYNRDLQQANGPTLVTPDVEKIRNEFPVAQ